MLSIGNARGSGVEHRDGNRHALAQDGTGIVDDDPNAIHEGGAELARLHSLRGKLGGRGDETDLAFEHRRPGRVGSDTHLHARLNAAEIEDRKSTRLNSSHVRISYAVFCLKKKKKNLITFTISNTYIKKKPT